MQGLLNSAQPTLETLAVRPALLSDRTALYQLTEHSHRAHFNLDWWTFDNWLYADRPSDAIWLAFFQFDLVGMLLALNDQGPTVWLRALAVANGYSADPIVAALLGAARRAWAEQALQQAVILAHPEWVGDVLRRLNFSVYNDIVTLRKSDRTLPDCAHLPRASIRPATSRDLPSIAANDRAAFDTVWQHSEKSLAHILKMVSHFVVAEMNDRVIGHAFSDLYGGQGHLIRLVVNPVYQRLGIGEQLLRESLQYQLTAGAYPLTLNTQLDNAPSQALYRRYGYHPMGRSVRVLHYPLIDNPP